MNKVLPIAAEYITPSRSIEILNLINQKESKYVYIYNFEGNHFRFFDSLLGLIRFFETRAEPEHSFFSEAELDAFLEKYGSRDKSNSLNLKLNYRYRDAGNYKQFGSVIFPNSSQLAVSEATKLIQEKLISEEFFIPKDWNIPRLQFHPYDPELDHEYHEFEEWEVTEEAPTDNRDVLTFLQDIEKGL
jgi:hypothetical protein